MDEQQPETIRCQHCDRPLTSERSRRNRAGDHCRRQARLRAAALDLTGWKDPASALDRAHQHIIDGALTRGDIPGTWLAASSRGGDVYEIDILTDSCTCKAREKWGHCTHLLAARIMTRPAELRPADVYALAA
jgi:hypothetical protein